MQYKHSTWFELLSENEKLLRELEANLKIEKKALLANDTSLLRESSLQKDKTLRQLSNFEEKSNTIKKSFAQSQGKQSVTLSEILDGFSGTDKRALQAKRQTLIWLSRSIKTLNSFNESCLKTYLDQVGTMQSLISLVTKQDQTYSSGGYTKKSKSGSLINRSF